ncbi:MAG: hypothetical protein ACK54C_13635 [Betaproteobacteria bacterium]|jgi:hypothetical protein
MDAIAIRNQAPNGAQVGAQDDAAKTSEPGVRELKPAELSAVGGGNYASNLI